MKKILIIVMSALLVMSLTVGAFAAESIAVKFEDAAGKTASGGTEPIFQMTDYSEFVEDTVVAVTFTSEDVPYLNLRSKTSPFSDSDNVWLFMEPSYVEGDVAYFTYDDVRQLYLDGTCQNSGVKTTDLQPDFEEFLKSSCDWIGIYTYDNTVTVTKVEIVKADTPSSEEAEPETDNTPEPEPAETEPEPAESEPEPAEPEPADTSAPKTGAAIAVIPSVLALAAAAVSKKK